MAAVLSAAHASIAALLHTEAGALEEVGATVDVVAVHLTRLVCKILHQLPELLWRLIPVVPNRCIRLW